MHMSDDNVFHHTASDCKDWGFADLCARSKFCEIKLRYRAMKCLNRHGIRQDRDTDAYGQLMESVVLKQTAETIIGLLERRGLASFTASLKFCRVEK